MMRILACGLVLPALLAAAPASAQLTDNPDSEVLLGGQIADMCLYRSGAPSMTCSAFLRGTFEGLMFGQISATGGMTSFCLPADGVSVGDLRQTFLDYVDDEPDRRTEEAGLLLLDSLQDRYPCGAADDGQSDGPPIADDDGLGVTDQARLFRPKGWKLARRR